MGLLLAAATALLPIQAAARLEVRAITRDNTPATREVVDALRNRFPGLVVGSDVNALVQRKGPAIYLAVGPAALQAAMASELHAPVVSLFTSSQTFHQIVTGARPAGPRGPVTAIFAEASPEHQLRLISAIFQRRVSVGVMLGSATVHLEPLLVRAARAVDVEIEVRRVSPGTNIVRELGRLGGADVLLAVPDANIFSPDNIRNILESTYRRTLPVVGFSRGMVAAGALASAYSSLDDIVAQSVEIVAEVEAGSLPEPRYPIYWRVAINDSVARSLNILIADDVRALGRRASIRPR